MKKNRIPAVTLFFLLAIGFYAFSFQKLLADDSGDLNALLGASQSLQNDQIATMTLPQINGAVTAIDQKIQEVGTKQDQSSAMQQFRQDALATSEADVEKYNIAQGDMTKADWSTFVGRLDKLKSKETKTLKALRKKLVLRSKTLERLKQINAGTAGFDSAQGADTNGQDTSVVNGQGQGQGTLSQMQLNQQKLNEKNSQKITFPTPAGAQPQ